MGRSSWLRCLAHGIVSGALLSCSRAPLGLDWTQITVVQGNTAALFRAAALLGIALSLHTERVAFRSGPRASWLAALCAGYALHGLVLNVAPGSRAGYALALVAATLLLFALAGPRVAIERDTGADTTLDWKERAGLFLAGIGLALALEPLAHEVRLFTLANSADDTVVGSVFLGLIALGAVSFGPLAARLGSERTRFAAGLGLGAASVLGGLLFLRLLGPDGLHGYLRRFDPVVDVLRTLDRSLGGSLGLASLPPLDGASIGTFWTTAIVASAALIGPTFLLGASIGSTRRVGRLAPVLLGSALGLVLLPPLIHAFGRPLTSEEGATMGFAWGFLAAGSGLAAVGMALVASRVAQERVVGLLLAAFVAGLPWLRPGLVLWTFSPWSPTPVRTLLIWPTPEGLLTVERGRDGSRLVTLDRKRLTPIREEEVGDERCLRIAWERLPTRAPGTRVRGLFVGQVTPPRARVLGSFEGLELDRTAPWHASMPAIEELVFEGEGAPPGRVVTPGEARATLLAGEYDWVVVPSIRGPIVTWKSEAREIWASSEALRLTDLELEPGTLGVAWLSSNSLASRGTSLEPLYLTIEGLESLAFALVRGDTHEPDLGSGPVFRLSLRSSPSPLRFLCTMPQQRPHLLGAAWSAGLSSAAVPDLIRGLQLHFSEQVLSSPYETRAQQIELEEDSLRAFFKDVPEPGALDRLTRELWETLAWLFTEKRMPEQALAFLEPLTERFSPWPALDVAMGHAYREFLEPKTALGFLERALRERPDVPEVWVEAARCHEDLGEPRRAAELLQRAMALAPGRRELLRLLGMNLARAGDLEGQAILERILMENPEDEEVRRILQQAPGATEGDSDSKTEED